MKILNIVLIAFITLLSIAAGFAKVMEMPQEVQFLQGFGFNSTLVIAYGLLQITGGVLLMLPRTIRLGALITIFSFGLSAILIFISGNTIFAFASLLPIAMTAYILWQSGKSPIKSA
ncbi:DoxX family protein [Thalassotalea litorea]|uniref:DoxX family protein n=1 Tax=Thalassotalea litorea TaxID=2020715 RepID=UPI0037357C05